MNEGIDREYTELYLKSLEIFRAVYARLCIPIMHERASVRASERAYESLGLRVHVLD